MDELLIAICKVLQNSSGNSMLSGSKHAILGCLQMHFGKSARVEFTCCLLSITVVVCSKIPLELHIDIVTTLKH